MGASRTSRRSSESGYSLVVLVIAVTVLNIMVAAMLPLWSTAIKREKEEELIFRGFQYAEAIRVFHQRYQNYPTKLEQLLEVKPRCIRQLWKDPMTEDGKWGLIFQNQPQGPLQGQLDPNRGQGQSGDKDGRNRNDEAGEGDEDDGDSGPKLGISKGEEVQVGPIIGVRSKSGEKSMILMFGRERYDEWDFTETRLLGNTQPRNEGGWECPHRPAGSRSPPAGLAVPCAASTSSPLPAFPRTATCRTAVGLDWTVRSPHASGSLSLGERPSPAHEGPHPAAPHGPRPSPALPWLARQRRVRSARRSP